MSESHCVILRRVLFNGVVIEDGRYMGSVADEKQGKIVAALFDGDTKSITKTLVGFTFEFYTRVYE